MTIKIKQSPKVVRIWDMQILTKIANRLEIKELRAEKEGNKSQAKAIARQARVVAYRLQLIHRQLAKGA